MQAALRWFIPVLATVLALGGGRARAGEARRRRVHVDHLDPAKVQQYEQARREWLAWIVEHKAVDPWGGLFLQMGPSTFLTLRPFDRFAELDPAASPVPIDGQVRDRYNERSDATLVPPHFNEIWLRQGDLDYQPAPPVEERRGVGRIVFEQIRLGADDHVEAWAAIRAELAAAHYPVARIVFSSQFGTGRQVSLWMAPDREVFARTPSIDQVLGRRLGKERAAALLARWRGAVLEREEHDVVARPDLSNP